MRDLHEDDGHLHEHMGDKEQSIKDLEAAAKAEALVEFKRALHNAKSAGKSSHTMTQIIGLRT
jgi:hypothetical protein